MAISSSVSGSPESAATDIEPPCVTPTRAISHRTSTILFVRAGGRCQRRGCNARLFEHHLSKQPGNVADRAPIVAFSEGGPRGNDGPRPPDINEVDNLMALCKACHKEIDDHPEWFSRHDLRAMKDEHERRVDAALDASPDLASHIISFAAPIRGFRIAIPRQDMFSAILPRHAFDGLQTSIDLGALTGLDEQEDLLSIACRRIDRAVSSAYGTAGPVEAAGHVSLFAIGPIPLLTFLGAQLGDKVAVDLYQRHRDTEDWRWKPDTVFDPIGYCLEYLEDRGEDAPVAILLSLSGKIDMGTLPAEISETHTIYEISLKDVDPTPTFLNCARDLIAFRTFWHETQSKIAARHGDDQPISIFPAVPAPIAVSIGKDRLPKARAPLRLYDNDTAKGGFTFQMEID